MCIYNISQDYYYYYSYLLIPRPNTAYHSSTVPQPTTVARSTTAARYRTTAYYSSTVHYSSTVPQPTTVAQLVSFITDTAHSKSTSSNIKHPSHYLFEHTHMHLSHTCTCHTHMHLSHTYMHIQAETMSHLQDPVVSCEVLDGVERLLVLVGGSFHPCCSLRNSDTSNLDTLSEVSTCPLLVSNLPHQQD